MTLFAKSNFVLVGVAAACFYFSYTEPTEQAVQLTTPSAAEQNVFGPGLAPTTATSPQPPTTDVRNDLFAVQANGDLIVDAHTPEKLEILVAGFAARQRGPHMSAIETLAAEGLSERTAAQALHTVRAYVAYRSEERALLSQPRSADQIAAAADMHERVVALRRKYFGAEMANTMFAQEEAASRFGMEMARIQGDPSLHEDDRAARIANLQRSQPAAPLRQEAAAADTRYLQARIAALRENSVATTQ